MNSTIDIGQLEMQAKKERAQLNGSVEDLRRKIHLTKKRMNPSALARDHFAVVSSIAALTALTIGYAFGTMFGRK